MNKTAIFRKTVGEIKEEIEKTVSAGSSQISGKPARRGGFASNKDREDFLRDLYGNSDNTNTNNTERAAEEKKLMEIRQSLHSQNYYEPLVHPVKPEEERPAERVDREGKREEQELQQKEVKKPPPLAVQREATRVERLKGVSG